MRVVNKIELWRNQVKTSCWGIHTRRYDPPSYKNKYRNVSILGLARYKLSWEADSLTERVQKWPR